MCRVDGDYGVVKVMFRLVVIGIGVIVGGFVCVVLELVGVENVLGKELGSKNFFNNVRVVVEVIGKMK